MVAPWKALSTLGVAGALLLLLGADGDGCGGGSSGTGGAAGTTSQTPPPAQHALTGVVRGLRLGQNSLEAFTGGTPSAHTGGVRCRVAFTKRAYSSTVTSCSSR